MNTMKERSTYMVLAKLTSKGQITIPKEIREKLSLNEGTKILFYQNELGQVVIENANIKVFHDIQNAMKGEAEKAGLYTEEDVVKLVRDIRRRCK